MKKVSEAMLDGLKQVKGRLVCVLYSARSDCACAEGCALIGFGVPKPFLHDWSLPVSVETRLPLEQRAELAPAFTALRAANAALQDAGQNTIAGMNDRGLSVEEIAALCASVGC